MRKLKLLACSVAALAAFTGSAVAAKLSPGTLSVEDGRGVVMLDLRGSVLGRLTNGSLRVTDLTPRDPFDPFVVGRKLLPERLGPRTVIYRGQGIRFRMVGGRYRIVVRGSGISVSAVGRGAVVLDAEHRWDEEAGLYSFEGVDCAIEPTLCTPLPEEPVRFELGEPELGEGRGPSG